MYVQSKLKISHLYEHLDAIVLLIWFVLVFSIRFSIYIWIFQYKITLMKPIVQRLFHNSVNLSIIPTLIVSVAFFFALFYFSASFIALISVWALCSLTGHNPAAYASDICYAIKRDSSKNFSTEV